MHVCVCVCVCIVVLLSEYLGGGLTGGATDSTPGTPGAPIDCVVSAWVDGSEGCTQKCGGSKTQTRTVITQDANGGKQCPILWRTVTCDNSGCAVDCVVGPWSPWSGCTPACGLGTQTRVRLVTTPAKNGGVVCPALSESQGCSGPPCPPPPPPPTCACMGVSSCNHDCTTSYTKCMYPNCFVGRPNMVCARQQKVWGTVGMTQRG
jgi:hypothetical protein